jgi:hypothetical protein
MVFLVAVVCVFEKWYISLFRFSRLSFLIHSTLFGCSKILWEITHGVQNQTHPLYMCPPRPPASKAQKAPAVPKPFENHGM